MKTCAAGSSCAMPPKACRPGRLARGEAGFILPMAVLLVVMLAISGTSFMHLDYLERLMTMNEVGNHGAFYLANAGLVRAREEFKIGSSSNWTLVLSGAAPGYALENPPDPVLCAAGKNCILPPFGASASSPELPFDAGFSGGTYAVRAFNDAAEAGNTDVNGLLTLRALGNVHGEQKVVQINVQAISGLNLINCQGEAGSPCPDVRNPNATISYLDGRAPSASPQLPSMPPLASPLNPSTCNPANLYCNRNNLGAFGLTQTITLSGGSTTLSSLQNNTYYFARGNVTIKSSGTNHNVVIVALGNISTQGNVTLNNSMLVSGASVSLKGNFTISAVLPFPAVISSGAVNADNSVTAIGTIYASGPVDFRPLQIQGVIIGSDVTLQGAATLVTDGGNAAYYAFMPGFTYPSDLQTTALTSGSWQELQ